MHRRNPAIAAALHCLDEDRVVGGIAQRFAQATDGAADALVKINEHVFRPKGLPKFLAADNLGGTAEQKCEGTKRQVLDPYLHAIPA